LYKIILNLFIKNSLEYKSDNNIIMTFSELVLRMYMKLRGILYMFKEFNNLTHIWENEEMPRDWSNGIICHIFKKGNRAECANYRGIMLLSVPYKIVTVILLKRLEIYSERNIE